MGRCRCRGSRLRGPLPGSRHRSDPKGFLSMQGCAHSLCQAHPLQVACGLFFVQAAGADSNSHQPTKNSPNQNLGNPRTWHRCRPPVKELDEEGKRKAIKSLLAEFSSTLDRREATTCVQELGDGALPCSAAPTGQQIRPPRAEVSVAHPGPVWHACMSALGCGSALEVACVATRCTALVWPALVCCPRLRHSTPIPQLQASAQTSGCSISPHILGLGAGLTSVTHVPV